MTFNVGDVVVHVVDPTGWMPVGTVCRVTKVVVGSYKGKPSPALHLKGRPHGNSPGWEHSTFRHLPKADETFIAQIRAIKPTRERCPS